MALPQDARGRYALGRLSARLPADRRGARGASGHRDAERCRSAGPRPGTAVGAGRAPGRRPHQAGEGRRRDQAARGAARRRRLGTADGGSARSPQRCGGVSPCWRPTRAAPAGTSSRGRLRAGRGVPRRRAGRAVQRLPDRGTRRRVRVLRRRLLRAVPRHRQRRPVRARDRLVTGLRGVRREGGHAADLRLARRHGPRAPDRPVQPAGSSPCSATTATT